MVMASYLRCKNQDCISASRANLVNAPTRGQVLTCIIDLCKVWACFCVDLKCLFVTSFISSIMSYPCCKNQDCISASRANLVNAPTRGQVLTCIIDLCKVWACFCVDLKCLFVTSFISSIMSYPCYKNQDCISASRANLVNAPTRGQVLTCIIDLCQVWACFCLDLKCLFVTSFISSIMSYPCCKNQDCISASRANLVNAPRRGQVLTCIIDLCKVWACFCLDLKTLFVTSFISSIMS